MTLKSEALGVTEDPEREAASADASFYEVLRDSISYGMNRILGVEGTRAILYHLDLPNFDDPKKFHERLTEIFGFGTPSLERVIIQRLHQTVGFSPVLTNNDDFVSQVELARRSFEAQERPDARREGVMG